MTNARLLIPRSADLQIGTWEWLVANEPIWRSAPLMFLLCAVSAHAQTKSSDAETVQAEHSDIGLTTAKTSGAVHTLNPEAQWYPDAGLGLFIHGHVRTHAYGHETRQWLGGILQHLDDRMATHRATLPRARLPAGTARSEPFARRELLARRRTSGHGRILRRHLQKHGRHQRMDETQ